MSENISKFTWVETYKDIVEYLKDKKNDQKSLINLLKEIGITGFKDQDENNKEIELSEIDPFTFFCYLNKYGPEKRIKFLQKLAKKLNFQNIPNDDSGIPTANAQKLHLFPFKTYRDNNEIETLWELFFKAIGNEINDDLFDKTLKIRSVGKTKLTEALFNIDPERYFPINGPTKPYIEELFKINSNFNTYTEYQTVLDKLRKKIDKPFYEISFDAWEWKKLNPKRYWLYAPGENAKMWDEFYDQGIMGLGWIELGDLNQYKTKKEISDKLKELDKKGSSKSNDTITNYDFKDTISIGDIVIAKKGRTEYLGYGVVKSDYYYDDNKEYYKKCRKVDWKKKGSWKEDGKIVLKTLTDITKYPEYVAKIIKLIGIEDGTSPFKMGLPLNTIIYGPPGTGKTYRLKNEFFDKFTDEQSIQTKEEFCHELIQDLSWWEVISIVMLDLKKAKVQAIFEHPLIQAKARISETKTPKNTIWSLLQRHTKDDCPNVNFKKRDNPQFFEKDTQSNWIIDEEIAKIETPDFYDVLGKYQNFTPQTESKKRYVFTTFHQSFSYEDFIEGIKPKLMKNEEDLESQEISYHIENGIFKNIANKALNDPENDYAIFIDEINRGNIANIFGELITLIEEDKRKGCENYIPAILPYSKTEFGVPNNLFIIGTMNTADRSVEALDNALRRRFSFLEMNPEPENLSQEEFVCEGIDLEKLLFSINSRIEKLLDKDYCIGHSYFMNFHDRENPLEDLKRTFSNTILPLLQEYFYGDWGKIMLVLGKGFIEKKIESVNFLATEDYDDFEDYDEKPVFNLVSSDNWILETFKKIYEKK